MLKKKCPVCGKELMYLCEVHLIDDLTAGYEGACSECNTTVYHKFRMYEIEIQEHDEFMEEKDLKIEKIM
jgi:hypothetical protein